MTITFTSVKIAYSRPRITHSIATWGQSSRKNCGTWSIFGQLIVIMLKFSNLPSFKPEKFSKNSLFPDNSFL